MNRQLLPRSCTIKMQLEFLPSILPTTIRMEDFDSRSMEIKGGVASMVIGERDIVFTPTKTRQGRRTPYITMHLVAESCSSLSVRSPRNRLTSRLGIGAGLTELRLAGRHVQLNTGDKSLLDELRSSLGSNVPHSTMKIISGNHLDCRRAGGFIMNNTVVTPLGLRYRSNDVIVRITNNRFTTAKSDGVSKLVETPN
ncbi:hypothetical protein BDN72DRAFT_124827 [Pluteus cervinus]|uniref:Uncharacterized protein n=1 Tax=Pluteus cervinus TaxID=181527 RepID=A0ACD3AMU6_9AGAR|nr:hypothetical protein BDN72DRAFT_124827 [Pluteus cervinus]